MLYCVAQHISRRNPEVREIQATDNTPPKLGDADRANFLASQPPRQNCRRASFCNNASRFFHCSSFMVLKECR